MGCNAGLNQIVALSVPTADRSEGAAVDVSSLVARKSVEISGDYKGSYVILGSHDGLKYVPVLVFNSGAGEQSWKQTMKFTLRFMKVRRRASKLVTINVSSQLTCTC